MKPFHALLILAAASIPPLQAQTISGTQLEIGPAGSNQVSGNLIGAAIGSNNQVTSEGSLALGRNNTAYSNSLAVGWGNYCAYESLAIGTSNSSEARSSLLVGSLNFAEESSDFTAFDCLLVGTSNWMSDTAARGLMAGWNNVVSGGMEFTISCASVLGRGLYNQYNSATLVGQYNDTGVPYDSGLLFAIGNGADATHRSNAFEVYTSGKITMPRQGDVLMGEFGNAGD